MTRRQAIKLLREEPYKFGHMLGFKDLTELHNEWIKEMAYGTEEKTIQAHRGSYKTTCVSIALALIIILFPSYRVLFVRKTGGDTTEIIKQTQNILLNAYTQAFVKAIYGLQLVLTEMSGSAINTNLNMDIKGTAQLVGVGTATSITGKHYDIIFTDDIVNSADRVSQAERNRTKLFYQELQNVKNRGGKIYNTGTPWHKEDCFTIMPEADKYSCYDTGLISEQELDKLKSSMTKSLFAANYELRHIAEEDVIFDTPDTGVPEFMVEQGVCHVDAAYYGEDYTAFTIALKKVTNTICSASCGGNI